MMSLETRAHIQVGGDDYLGPFSQVQIPEERLDGYLKGIWSGKQSLTSVKREGTDGEQEKIAEGFEFWESLSAMMGDQKIHWQERRLVIHSFGHARAAERGLTQRLEKAQAALEALTERKQGKEVFSETEALRQAVDKILERYEVQDLLQVQITEHVQARQVRQYGDRPAETRKELQLTLKVHRNEAVI